MPAAQDRTLYRRLWLASLLLQSLKVRPITALRNLRRDREINTGFFGLAERVRFGMIPSSPNPHQKTRYKCLVGVCMGILGRS